MMGEGGGPSDFFGSENLAKSDFFGSMIGLRKKKQRDFYDMQKKDFRRVFFGYAKKSSDFFG